MFSSQYVATRIVSMRVGKVYQPMGFRCRPRKSAGYWIVRLNQFDSALGG